MGGNYVVTTSCGCVVTFTDKPATQELETKLTFCKKHGLQTPQAAKERGAILAAARLQWNRNCKHANN